MNLVFTQIDPPPDWAVTALEKKGWTCVHQAFRRVVFLDAPAEDLAAFDLLIVTSKQAARWLQARAPTALPPVAAVGRATSALLPGRRLAFGDDPPANAVELCARLRRSFTQSWRGLFLRGEAASPTIPKELADFDLTCRTVYKTEKISKNFAASPGPCMVYFQAPSTVMDFVERLRRPPTRIASIGPSTSAAIEKLGWSIDFTPSRPEIQFLVEELPPPAAFDSEAREQEST